MRMGQRGKKEPKLPWGNGYNPEKRDQNPKNRNCGDPAGNALF